jgi:hypothetical protein
MGIMKRVFLQLVLAAALIVQGAAGAFGKTASESMHGPCCPQGAVDGQTHHAKCPCPQKQHCASDCQLLCEAGSVTLIASQRFAIQHVPASSLRPVRDDDLARPRSDTPPIRPPIG